MNPIIIKIAQFFGKRPSDNTIRAFRILSGIIIAALIWLARDVSILDVPFAGAQTPETEKMIEYILMAILGIPLVIRGLVHACIFRHNTLRILQMILGFFLIILGGPIMDPIMTTIPGNTNNALGIATESVVQYSWHPGIFLILLGIFWMLVGATGKGTTSKCIMYGEIVKKIRI